MTKKDDEWYEYLNISLGEIYKEVFVLSNLSTDEIEYLQEVISPAEIIKGDFIYRKGEPATRMLIIYSGSVDVLLDERSGPLISTLRRGDTIGELSLLNRYEYHVNYRAGEDVLAFSLERGVFQSLYHEALNIWSKISFNLARLAQNKLQDSIESQERIFATIESFKEMITNNKVKKLRINEVMQFLNGLSSYRVETGFTSARERQRWKA